MIKKCPKCNIIYENAELASHRCSRNKDGLDWKCKICKQKSENTLMRRRRDLKRYVKLKDRQLARSMARDHYEGQEFKCAILSCHFNAEELHHVNYDCPLDVIPLCKRHHRENHALCKIDEA